MGKRWTPQVLRPRSGDVLPGRNLKKSGVVYPLSLSRERYQELPARQRDREAAPLTVGAKRFQPLANAGAQAMASLPASSAN